MKDFKTLTKHGKANRYRRALLQALERYPVRVKSVRFISLDSKPVFRVATAAGDFAAKFQDPKEHVLSQMMGEMQFLDHVSKHTELCVETPIANVKGEFVTEIESDWLPEPAHVALCRWLPGSQLEHSISVRSYRQLGKCSAVLHEVSPTFRPRQNFSILINNQVFYWDKETILSRQDRTLLPKGRQSLFRDGSRLAETAIVEVWNSGKPIIIHNDLHPCNVKVHGGTLALYDFEDIAWGFPGQDIGTAMYHVRFRDDFRELLGAFREGYERIRSWPLDSDRQLDRFVIARLLMFANYVVNFDISPAKYLSQFETKLEMLLNG